MSSVLSRIFLSCHYTQVQQNFAERLAEAQDIQHTI